MISIQQTAGFAFAALLLYLILRQLSAERRYAALAEQHGCLAPPLLENQRPLGVDRLEQIFRANTESRLMELFLFHFRQTGNTLKQCFLTNPAFGTIEPANLEAILSTRYKDWSTNPRREITFPLFGEGIFTQEGDAWRASRQLLRRPFHHKQYEDLTVFDESIQDLIQAIIHAQDSNGVVDLQPLFFRFTLDTTTAFLFGESIQSLRAPDVADEQTFADAFNLAQEYVAKRFRLRNLYWLIGGRRFRDACRVVHQFADKIIDRVLDQDTDKDTGEQFIFLDSVAKNCRDRAALRGQIVNILAAGRDTTACLLSWTFFTLVRYPHVLKKLKAEIRAQGKSDPSASLHREDLLGMKYLHNVIKEVLRLYPSLPVNTRTSIRGTILPKGGGRDRQSPVFIPKGTAVAFSVYSMHRRPDLFGMDAEIFRPERWDDDLPMNQDPTLRTWGYLPFNGGPRICLGMDFAVIEATYAVIRLLQHFPNLALPPGEVVELTGAEKQAMTLVISITHGCNIQLTRNS